MKNEKPSPQPTERHSTHHVHRGPESLPCYCAATVDHNIGQEKAHPATPPPQTNVVADNEDRMTQIKDLIKELQGIASRFGNTCVYIRRGGLSWGAVALNRRDDDKKNGVFDLQAQHDRDVALLCERIENLKAERKELRAALATTEGEDNG